MQKFVQETLKEIREIHILLYKLKLIREKEKKLKEELKEIEILFKRGLIGDKTYNKLKNEIEEEVRKIDDKKYYIINRILQIIDDIDNRIKFLLETREISKDKWIKEKIDKTLEIIHREIKKENISKPVVQRIKELKYSIPRVQINIRPKIAKGKIEIEKRKPKLSRVAVRLYQELKRRKEERKNVLKRKVIIVHKTKKHSTINIFEKIANKYFGGLADFIIKNFPDLYAKFYEVLRRSGIKTLSKTYFALMLFLTIIVFIFSLVIDLILHIFVFKSFNPLSFFIFLILITLFSIPLTIAIFLIYPYIKEKERRENIDAALPFALVQMSAIASANVSPYVMIKVIANTEEFKDLSDELKKVIEYIDYMGYDLTTALRMVAEETPSYKLKDFLKGLASIIKSGGNVAEYIKEKALDALIHYRTERKKFIQALQTYSDLYTGIVVAAPLFFIATLAVLQTMGGKVFNIDISKAIFFGTYVFIPLINILFLLFIHITQPKG